MAAAYSPFWENVKKAGIFTEIVVKLFFGKHILWLKNVLCKVYKKI